MMDNIPFIKNSEGKYAVPCQIKISDVCVQSGEFCVAKEDARDWVEDDFWIFSGEGWICPRCNEQIYVNMAKIKPKHMR
jgi:hypothetical protein